MLPKEHTLKVSIPFTTEEMAQLAQILSEKDMTASTLCKQALRLYVDYDNKLSAGEKVSWSGDANRARDFCNVEGDSSFSDTGFVVAALHGAQLFMDIETVSPDKAVSDLKGLRDLGKLFSEMEDVDVDQILDYDEGKLQSLGEVFSEIEDIEHNEVQGPSFDVTNAVYQCIIDRVGVGNTLTISDQNGKSYDIAVQEATKEI